jgi:hypothetical protein
MSSIEGVQTRKRRRPHLTEDRQKEVHFSSSCRLLLRDFQETLDASNWEDSIRNLSVDTFWR